MRIHFQSKPWDLFAVGSCAIGVPGILIGLGVGNFAAVFFIFLLPGYVLIALLFPSNNEIRWIERIALSFVLSLAVVPLLGLILNSTPFGITFASFVATIALFTILVGVAAYVRRMRLPLRDRLAFTLNLQGSLWQQASAFDKALAVVAAASITTAVGTLAFVALVPRPGELYTEFYVLGPGGNASGYPKALNVSEPGTVIVGIANHESATVNYTIRIDLVGVRIVYNATSGFNETVEVNRTTWSTINVPLADGNNWTRPYTFQINYTGLWKVQFLLFNGPDLTGVHRELHLYVRVT